MRTAGLAALRWYVWDQGRGCPATGWSLGRVSSSFSFQPAASRKPNKIVPCKHAGQESHLRADGSSTAMRGKDGEVGGWTPRAADAGHPDSRLGDPRDAPQGKDRQDIDHPAVFPVALPEFVIEAFTDAGDIVFEPFGGSGSTMLARSAPGACRAVEIAPEYVDVAIKRFQQNHPAACHAAGHRASPSTRSPVNACHHGGHRAMTASWFADKIEQWPTAKLMPYARNARTHQRTIRWRRSPASIAEFGFTNPILAAATA